jgi:hypothetical protein
MIYSISVDLHQNLPSFISLLLTVQLPIPQKRLVDWVGSLLNVRVAQGIQEGLEFAIARVRNLNTNQDSAKIITMIAIVKQRDIPVDIQA